MCLRAAGNLSLTLLFYQQIFQLLTEKQQAVAWGGLGGGVRAVCAGYCRCYWKMNRIGLIVCLQFSQSGGRGPTYGLHSEGVCATPWGWH